MKAVLISIQPKWLCKILCGIKTVEVRKTRPQIDTPFKVYLYCTQPQKPITHLYRNEAESEKLRKKYPFITTDHNRQSLVPGGYLNGKIVGEFICNEIERFVDYDEYNEPYWNFSADLKEIERVEKSTCLTLEQIIAHIGDSKNAYGWHISDLKIYDKPKEVKEFIKPCDFETDCDYCCPYAIWDDKGVVCGNYIGKAPQSWCYVEADNGK